MVVVISWWRQVNERGECMVVVISWWRQVNERGECMVVVIGGDRWREVSVW